MVLSLNGLSAFEHFMHSFFDNLSKAYFIGIGGIGVSALAKLFKSYGVLVEGSDAAETELTRELSHEGIAIHYGHDAAHITSDVDLVVYSAAVPETNPERKQAKKLKIQQKSYFDVIGQLTKLAKTIAVSGTNGKSTTTSMLASIMIDAKEDPTVIVGSKHAHLGGNYRRGGSDYFIVEACEYRAHILKLTPRMIVLTNIEEEHMDYFRDLRHILDTFQEYIDKLTQTDDVLVINADDPNIAQLSLPNCHVITYGIETNADIMAKNIRIEPGKQLFDIEWKGKSLGTFELVIPGAFNIANALAAMAVPLHVGISADKIRESLKHFPGIWRRFQRIKTGEVTVISDYAHHPAAVRGTIHAAKDFYPNHRIIAVFQPHQFDRTKKLFNDFVDSLYEADVVILPEVFDVIGREDKAADRVGSKQLAEAVQKNYPEKKVMFAKNLAEAVDLTNFNLHPNDVVLMMGAGDIYTVVGEIGK